MAWGGGLTGLGQLMAAGAGLGKAYQDYQQQQERQRRDQLILEEFRQRQAEEKRKNDTMAALGQVYGRLPPMQSPQAGMSPGAAALSTPDAMPATSPPPQMASAPAPPQMGASVSKPYAASSGSSSDTLPSGQPLIPQSPAIPANARYASNDPMPSSTARPIPVLDTPQGRQIADMGAGTVSGGKDASAGFMTQMAQQGGNPQKAQGAALAAYPRIPQQFRGSLQGPDLAKIVDDVMGPGADPATKGMVIQHLIGFADKRTQQEFEQWKVGIGERDKDRAYGLQREEFDEAKRHARVSESQAATQGNELVSVPGQPPLRYNPRTNQQSPSGLPAGAVPFSAAGTRTRTDSNVQVTDDQGKVIYKGAAHQLQDGTYVKPTGETLDGNITLLGKGGEGSGRQAQAMTGRIMGAVTQASRALENIAKMPQGATMGVFQGIQQERGDSLTEGVKRSLSNSITPESANMMSVVTRGLARSLATLESQGAATGLVGLANQMTANTPAAGDSGLVALGKLADMRQIVEGAIETLQASPSITQEQKDLLAKNFGRITDAIPFTVADVIKLQSDPSDQTYNEFAKSIGLGGGKQEGGAPSGARPPIESFFR